jgi:hypothetical protein
MPTQINNQIHRTKYQLEELDTNRKPLILEICSWQRTTVLVTYLHIFHTFVLIVFSANETDKQSTEQEKDTDEDYDYEDDDVEGDDSD